MKAWIRRLSKISDKSLHAYLDSLPEPFFDPVKKKWFGSNFYKITTKEARAHLLSHVLASRNPNIKWDNNGIFLIFDKSKLKENKMANTNKNINPDEVINSILKSRKIEPSEVDNNNNDKDVETHPAIKIETSEVDNNNKEVRSHTVGKPSDNINPHVPRGVIRNFIKNFFIRNDVEFTNREITIIKSKIEELLYDEVARKKNLEFEEFQDEEEDLGDLSVLF